jgi:heme A synthase
MLSEIHTILFNAVILFSVLLGIWAAVLAGRNQPISGNYWGAVLTFSGLAALTLLVGIIMTLQGLRPGPDDQKRLTIYLLYMAFLVVIMPGLFSMLRGRDDRSAGIAFAILAFFNASTAVSMVDRMVTGPWT